jgi:hypothetical protein
MISVGMLYDAQKLLGYIASSSATTNELLKSFKRLEVADFAAVLSIAQQCQWIEVSESSQLILSTQGRRICQTAGVEVQLRHQLRDVLACTSPAWAKKIADGRSEAIKIMPEAVQQAFREAGLLREWDDELVDWWDSIGLAARSRKNEGNLQTGRKAEKLSMSYEELRTGRRPQWKCIDTNYAGYDILSIVEQSDPRPCAIEVKGSARKLKEATFILTRREWEVAEDNDAYRLHLWLIRSEEQMADRDLRVVASSNLAQHIPHDKGEGEWISVEVPFDAFWA